MRLYVHDPKFSGFGTIPACDAGTDGRTHDDSIYHASIASCGKKSFNVFLFCQILNARGRPPAANIPNACEILRRCLKTHGLERQAY